LILTGLVYDANPEEVWNAISRANPAWLATAIALRAFTLTLHEVRLWFALLPWGRFPLMHVVIIGWIAGLMNTLLPIRGGDLIGVALLRKELSIDTSKAIASVGITAFLEVVLFASFTLIVLSVGLTRWESLVGVVTTQRAMGSMTLIILGGIAAAIVLTILSKRFRKRDRPTRRGPLELIRESVVETGTGLKAWRPVAGNASIGIIQVITMVLSTWALLPALGLQPPLALLAVCGLIAFGSIAAIVLPQSLGAGPAATAIFVLGFFGISEPDAIAMAALLWLSATLPPLATGTIPLIRRIRHMGTLLRTPSAE